MLIFDSFPSRKHAEKFVNAIWKRFYLSCQIHDSQDASNKADLFPFKLYPPIVLVERGYKEEEVEQLVDKFEGRFAGT